MGVVAVHYRPGTDGKSTLYRLKKIGIKPKRKYPSHTNRLPSLNIVFIPPLLIAPICRFPGTESKHHIPVGDNCIPLPTPL